MHSPSYSQLTKPLYQVTSNKSHFMTEEKPKQIFDQIKQEVACAMALLMIQKCSNFAIYRCRKEEQFLVTRAGFCGNDLLKR